MNKKYNLKLDLQFRCNNSTMKFDQFDNNTSDFFIKISNGGKSFDVEKAIVVLAIIKPSGKVASQFVEVENGLVYADLKSNMRDEIGTYTAKAMLILEDERVVTDSISYEVEEDKIFSLLNDTVGTSEEFTLLTDMLSRLSAIEISEEQRMINEAERILAEENRKIEETKRVEAELVRQHEEADRAKYDATRESNENTRKQNESIRLANETNRIDEEAKRVEEEAKRKLAEEERKANYDFMTEDEERRRAEANAHKEAEVLRVQAETNRVNEEYKRRTTEQGRVSAENTRVSNENVREANEVVRVNNETQRIETETQRQNRYNSFILDAEANANNFENYTNNAKVNEEERKANELDRKSQEDRRISNEVERISNENTRKANEVIREENETSRQDVFENKVNEVDEKIVELNTTKDNFISSINTKVDNKISELDSAKTDMTTTVSNKVNEVETRFNALTSNQQQDAEVIDARDGETSLKARLDRDIEKAKQVYVNVEGSHISTDSSVGYAKDVEILGNTIQDASNLADIRSVGDKVDGQELYEIPVLSVGKNLFDRSKYLEFDTNASLVSGRRIVPIKVKPNCSYTFSTNLIDALDGVTNTYMWLSSSTTLDDGTYLKLYPKGSSAQRTVTSNSNGELYLVYTGQTYYNSVISKLTNIQIEEGTQATPYEPYVEDKLTILSPVQLEKVGDVADRIIEKDGVWGVEKNVVTKIFNGSENWLYGNSKTKTLMCELKNYPDKAFGIGNILSDRFVTVVSSDQLWHSETEGICGCDNFDWIRININKEKLSEANQNGLKQWLQANPTTVKYQTTQPQFIPLPHDQQVKLRTFANKTNISFGCEIEGTIKAQVPKSLGATVNTHTEQIRSLNNELNRVKKLEESTVSTVTAESDFTTVEATSNGYFEDVKLEGKTLVNLANAHTVVGTGSDTKYTFDGEYYSIQKTSGYTIGISFKSRNASLEANKTYTIIINNKSEIQTFLYNNDYAKISNLSNGVNIIKYTPSSSQVIRVGDVSSASTEGLIKFSILILEGDHTQNPPSFFEGLKSVGQSATTSEEGVDEIVVSSVKGDGNLFDVEVVNGFINADTGVENNDVNQWAKTKSFIRVSPSTKYCISSKKTSTYFNAVIYYDSNRQCIGSNFPLNENNYALITTPHNAQYIKLRFRNYSGNSAILSDIQECLVIKSISEQPYTPHQSDKKRLLYYNEETQTWEKPILREWDSIEKHADGKYYYHQRSGEAVLNGSEGWIRYQQNTNTNVMTFAHNKSDFIRSIMFPIVLCDKFKYLSGGYTQSVENISTYSDKSNGGAFYITLETSKLPTQDVEGFKQWLQTNPTTVVYQLAQEKVYECTNIDLITYEGETNYIVESGAIVPRSTLKVHNNISNVVSLLQKKVSLLESDITSYMITQNRLMLASRYNADTVSFKVDVASFSDTFEYDNDLYELILNNILVGKDNYNREYIENLIIFYWMDFVISDEMYLTLFEIIEEQHNPKIIEEETPLI